MSWRRSGSRVGDVAWLGVPVLMQLGRVGRQPGGACWLSICPPAPPAYIADPKRFQDVLKSALWKDSVLRLKAQAQVCVLCDP